MQRDRSRALRGLDGAWRVKQHGYGLRQWVGIGVLMVQVVSVYVLPWRRWWDVSR